MDQRATVEMQVLAPPVMLLTGRVLFRSTLQSPPFRPPVLPTRRPTCWGEYDWPQNASLRLPQLTFRSINGQIVTLDAGGRYILRGAPPRESRRVPLRTGDSQRLVVIVGRCSSEFGIPQISMVWWGISAAASDSADLLKPNRFNSNSFLLALLARQLCLP
jgi:hypothetical protein